MTSRRAFLASLVAAIAGRSLFDRFLRFLKPEDTDTGISIRMIRLWDQDLARFTVRWDVLHGFPSMFNPREDLDAQYRALRFDRHAFTLADSAFERGFAKIGAPLYVPRPRGFPIVPIVHPDGSSHSVAVRG